MTRNQTSSAARTQGRVARYAVHLAIGAATLGMLQAMIPHNQPASIAPVTVVEAAPAVAPAAAVAAPPVEAETVAAIAPPVVEAITAPAPAAAPLVWRGTAARDANVRSAPRRDARIVRELGAGEAVEVSGWVAGDEIEPHNGTWAQIAPGQFVFSTLLRREALTETPPPADAPVSGKWIDVNLTLQVATAYEGTTAIRSVLISSGAPGWETPIGTQRITRRVEKETMDGSSLIGQGPDGKGATYRVENVRYTQYFTNDGSAIHENSWRDPRAFGMPGSHGCIGMPPADAAWFWSWAQVGTPLAIHR